VDQLVEVRRREHQREVQRHYVKSMINDVYGRKRNRIGIRCFRFCFGTASSSSLQATAVCVVLIANLYSANSREKTSVHPLREALIIVFITIIIIIILIFCAAAPLFPPYHFPTISDISVLEIIPNFYSNSVLRVQFQF